MRRIVSATRTFGNVVLLGILHWSPHDTPYDLDYQPLETKIFQNAQDELVGAVTRSNPPLPETRHDRILSLLEAEGAVRVTALARELGVTDETIRRDLDLLSQKGVLRRTHGGALRGEVLSVDPALTVRRQTNAHAKQAIATHAMRLLSDKAFFESHDRVLALDASSSAIELARRLPDCSMTVLTNGIETARALASHTNVRVFVTGGEYDSASACFVGPIAHTIFKQFAVDAACISCRAVDAERGCSESEPSHAAYKRAMVDAAEQVMLLIDSSKVGCRAVSFFLGLQEIDEIVTNASLSDERYAFLERSGAKVHTVAS